MHNLGFRVLAVIIEIIFEFNQHNILSHASRSFLQRLILRVYGRSVLFLRSGPFRKKLRVFHSKNEMYLTGDVYRDFHSYKIYNMSHYSFYPVVDRPPGRLRGKVGRARCAATTAAAVKNSMVHPAARRPPSARVVVASDWPWRRRDNRYVRARGATWRTRRVPPPPHHRGSRRRHRNSARARQTAAVSRPAVRVVVQRHSFAFHVRIARTRISLLTLYY